MSTGNPQQDYEIEVINAAIRERMEYILDGKVHKVSEVYAMQASIRSLEVRREALLREPSRGLKRLVRAILTRLHRERTL